MPERDSGWIQFYCEDAQEAYDTAILAVRLAERRDVLTPVFVCQDGFITSHCYEPVEFLPDDAVRDFVGAREPIYPLLDVDNPVTYGSFVTADDYFEIKRAQLEGMNNVPEAFEEVSRELGAITGRVYDAVERYRLEDADYAVVVMSSAAGVVKDVVDSLRDEGVKAGCLRIRMFRPFPAGALRAALAGARGVAVLDRSLSPGGTAPLKAEVVSSLYALDRRIPVSGYVFGLGGRDFFPSDAAGVFRDLERGETPRDTGYIGLRDRMAGVA
jgi:pyruvate ferredoxin oxidoreductase alpha subunit